MVKEEKENNYDDLENVFHDGLMRLLAMTRRAMMMNVFHD